MQDTIRRTVLWPAFCGLVALLVWGFRSGHLFEQLIWQPEGLRRFLVFAAIYAVWSLLANWWRPSWFLPLTAAVALIYTSIAVGPAAPGAVLWFLCSALIVGRLLFREVDDHGLALLAGISVYVLLIGVMVHFPINYPLVYAGLFGVPLLAVKQWRLRLPRQAAGAVLPLWERVARGLAVFVLLAHWLVALKPEVGADALAMHLVIPSWVAQHHFWPFDFRHLVWSLMPMNADWSFTAVYMLGGEHAARLLNFCLLAVVAALLNSAARRWLSAGTAWLVTALFLSSPVAQLVTGSLFAENFWAAMLLGSAWAVWKYKETGTGAYFVLAAMTGGTAVASKYAAVAYVVALACFGAAAARRRRHARIVWLALACLVVFAAPPYITAFVKTGNPVYPFANAVFRSPFYDTSVSLSDARFHAKPGWATPYDATFYSSRYLEGQNGALGFHYLLLLPLGVLLVGRRWPYAGWAAGATAAAGLAATFTYQANLRYAYAALPLVMLYSAAALSRLRAVDLALYRVVLGASLAALGLNLYFLPASGWYQKDFIWGAWEGRAEAERYLRASAPVRQLVEYLNREHPGLPVAFFQSSQVAGLRGLAYADNWHNDMFVRRLRAAGSAEDCRNLMQELGVRYFVAPAPGSGLVVTEVPADSFLARFTEPEYRRGPYQLARWKKDALPDATLPPAPPGRYDDLDTRIAFHGPWTRGREFPQASAGGITYCDAVGASLTFEFTGREVIWVYTAAQNRGMAEVTLDGDVRGRVDLYSPTVVWQAEFTLSGLPAGRHTLAVRILSEKNVASTGHFVDIDSLVVR
jgi:hypothetical protein